jgi:hypothetical protein
MTEPQRWDDWSGLLAKSSKGDFVRYADAKAWVEREVAAAEQRGREVVIVTQETHDAVKELCRAAYEQGRRDGIASVSLDDVALLNEIRNEQFAKGREAARARIRAAVEAHFDSWDYNGKATVLAVIDGTTPQDGTP